MIKKTIVFNALEDGVDAVVDVGEQQVAADLFDAEVDALVHHDLIAIFDGEVVDGVIALGETEAISARTSDEGVVSSAAVEAVVVNTPSQAVIASFPFENVIAFSALQQIVVAVADEGVVADPSPQAVIAFFAKQGVG